MEVGNSFVIKHLIRLISSDKIQLAEQLSAKSKSLGGDTFTVEDVGPTDQHELN